MYMSIIEINKNNCVMNSNNYDDSQIHKVLLEALNHKSRIDAELLYRKDKDAICVYSKNSLNQEKLFLRNYIVHNTIEIDNLYSQIQNGDAVKLFIKTSPSKKVDRKDNKNSARITLSQKDERSAWVERKLSNIGLAVLKDSCGQSLIIEDGHQYIEISHSKYQRNKGTARVAAYNYVVTAQVIDKDAFMDGVKKGIGPYKSYGCGLILVGAA